MSWRQLSDDIVVMSFPWRTLGIDFRRIVTLLRLNDGRVIIHSTAPFSKKDIEAIRRFGEPAWLVEATLMHDTYAKEGRAAFPELPYFAPDGFAKVSGMSTQLLNSPPPEWTGEIDVLPINGMRMNEQALFHRRSRTLVVSDLFFSFPNTTRGWPRFFARHFMRLPRLFGISAFLRFTINDRAAFERSTIALLQWNFEKLVVAHSEPLEYEAKTSVEGALRDFGVLS